VITVREGGVTYGANAWKSSPTYPTLPRRGIVSEIAKLISQEAEAAEADRDAPLPAGAVLSRPNRGRSTVYSIRLNPEEVAALQDLADAANVPSSTLARSWIVERIREEKEGLSEPAAELRAAQRHLAHLERHLRRDAS